MRDPALAFERTTLAWSRTALGLAGVGALLLRFARVEAVPVAGEVIAAIAFVAAVATWWYGHRSYGEVERSSAPLRALAAGVAAMALAIAVVVAVGLG